MKHDLKALRALCDAATDIDPQTVRALIDEIERLRGALEEIKPYVHMFGESHLINSVKQALGENDGTI